MHDFNTILVKWLLRISVHHLILLWILIPVSRAYGVSSPVVELLVGILDTNLLLWISEVGWYHYCVRILALLCHLYIIVLSLVIDINLLREISEAERRLYSNNLRNWLIVLALSIDEGLQIIYSEETMNLCCCIKGLAIDIAQIKFIISTTINNGILY